jgi:hypothetical protein
MAVGKSVVYEFRAKDRAFSFIVPVAFLDTSLPRTADPQDCATPVSPSNHSGIPSNYAHPLPLPGLQLLNPRT